MNALPGIGGSLFPARYLVDGVPAAFTRSVDATDLERRRRHLARWWRSVEAACGPATGLRALFDLVARPLARQLGFRVEEVTFDRNRGRVRLASPGGAAVIMLVLPWASHPSGGWRDVVLAARGIGANWGFAFAPPFLSLVDARAHAVRHGVEFALPAALGAESFARLWMVARASAFDRDLDRIVLAATTFQDGVRADLQAGVLRALDALRRVVPGAPDEALTIVYRLLFLLFAESRGLVPERHPVYRRAYAIGTLCRDALRPGPPDGLWHGLAAVTRLSRVGCRVDDLIVRPFNGRLFARSSAPALESGPRRARPTALTRSRDAALRDVLVALGTRAGRAGRESIRYADLGVEQLGAVYERVLDIDPSAPAGRRGGARPAGRSHSPTRKRTGTFYTPQPLAEFVVRRTLAPLVDGASSDAILALRVVDPAMGSGAFLVAACRFLADAYERALVDEGRLDGGSADESVHAECRRTVAERCLAGVDVSTTAVQLARLSLWLTTLARGKPLGFLDHRLRAGNSLVGAAPDDLARLAPGRLGATGRAARTAGPSLFDASDPELETRLGLVTRPLLGLLARADDTVDDVRAKEAAWARLAGDASPLAPWRQAADLWCARWWLPAAPTPPVLGAALAALLRRDPTLPAAVLARLLAAAREAAAAQQFFHWPLEFPDVFYDADGRPRERPGFDAVIGNPPWEMLRGDNGRDAPRRPLVRFIRESGVFEHCGHGHLNLYQPFLERALALARPGGRIGLILPWSVATDDGAAALRDALLDRGGLDTFAGLDNARGLFPIHRGLRFVVVTASPGAPAGAVRARFGITTAEEIARLPDRDDATPDDAAPAPGAAEAPIVLSPGRLRAIGGRTRRIPDLRDARDLVFLDIVMRAFPALGAVESWGVSFGRELNATDDRAGFGARGLAVLDGKHLSPFIVRAADAPRRIARAEAERRLPDRRFTRPRLGYRDVSGAGNRLCLIAAVLPADVVTTHTVFCLREALPIDRQHALCGLFNSWVLNAVVRRLMGSHVTTSLVESLPVPPWTGGPADRRIARLARALARPVRRPAVEAALQAAVARRYGLDAAMFEHVLDGVPFLAAGDRRRAIRAFIAAADRS